MIISLLNCLQFNGVPASSAPIFVGGADLVVLFYAAIAILGAIVHILLSLWVYDDARRLLIDTGDSAALVTRPWIWLFATLVGGILTLAVYWMIHRSTLSPRVLRELDREEVERPVDPATRIAAIKKKARRRAHSSDAEPQQPDSTTES